LDNKSKNKIQRAVDEYKGMGSYKNAFMKLVHPELITIDPGQSTKSQVIRSISQQLKNEGYASSGIYEAAIKREKLASTQIDFVAMPHAPVDFVKRPCISVYINTQGIEWSQGKVNIVFFLAMNQTIRDSINDVYGYFNDLLEDKQLLQRILRATTKDEVMKMLGSERVVE
jgi:mannitol/fructose-specific phosphotransferase system IIA component (Ntr-type)